MSDQTLGGPPHNTELERIVLASSMLHPELALDLESLLAPRDFYWQSHGLIFEAQLEIAERGEPGDPVALERRLQERGDLESAGGRDYLEALVHGFFSSALAAKRHAKRVCELARLRRIREAGIAIASIGTDTDDADLAEELAAAELQRATADRGASGLVHVRQTIRERLEAGIARASKQGGEVGISTGIPSLDRLSGLLARGNMYLLIGRTSMGKTALANSIIINVLLGGLRVFFASLEMTADDVQDRLLVALAGGDSTAWRTGSALSARMRQRYEEATATLEGCDLIVDQRASLSVQALRMAVLREHRRRPIDLVVVDYLGLMAADAGRERRHEELGQISAGVRAVGRAISAPVIALAQMNRAAETRDDKRPKLSDIRESGSLEQDADAVWGIYRPGYYDPSQPQDLAQLLVLKNRHGATGEIPLRWIAHQARYADAVDARQEGAA